MGNGLINCCVHGEGTVDELSSNLNQDQIKKAFSQAMRSARVIAIPDDTKLVIFSDIHKGNGDPHVDNFMTCKPIYLGALDHYLAQGYHLVQLGDVEDTWIATIEEITQAHQDTYQSERRFHDAHRLIKIVGNHDDIWYDPQQVQTHLWPLLGEISVDESVVLHFESGKIILLMHGHQGSYDPTRSRISKGCLSTCWTPCVSRLNQDQLSYQMPSQNHAIRNELDRIAREWIAENRVTTILGHTHHPVVHDDIRLEIVPGVSRCDDPNYFNTGSCIFNDHSITGIEIANQKIRLITWRERDQQIEGPLVLDETGFYIQTGWSTTVENPTGDSRRERF